MCPHRVLEISCSATIDEAKKAYRRLAKLYHPDINKSEEAHNKFILIQRAYEEIREGSIPRQQPIYSKGSATVSYTWTTSMGDSVITFTF